MNRPIVVSILLLCAIGAGCATQGPPPSEEMIRARTLIEQADKGDAQRYAAADLQKAHDELSNAEKSGRDRKFDDARRYAEAAAVDADVANARGAAAEAQRAAQEISHGNETLREESTRSTASVTPN